MQKALSSSNFQIPGACNTISFASSSGNRLGQVQLVQVENIVGEQQSRSRNGFDFVPLAKN